MRYSLPVLAVVLSLLAPIAALADEPTAASAPSLAVVEPAVDLSARAAIADFPAEAEIFANRGGFCLDLGCGNGALTAQIAAKTRVFVFAIATDDAGCEKTRHALLDAHLFGSRGNAVVGSLQKLPFPNGYGNLIVTGQYQPSLDLKEVSRVLNPNGIAVIGGAGTDLAKLKSALDAAGITGYKIAGNYAIFHGKLPENVEEWTHFTPRADNLHSVHATDLRPPFRTQWIMAEPDYDDKPVQHAAIANGHLLFRSVGAKPDPDRSIAFDAFNGAFLWQRPVLRGHANYRHALADGVFYTPDADHILGLDADTGQAVKDFRVPNTYWYWLAAQDGVLYAMGSCKDVPMNGKGALGACTIAVAFDLKTNRQIWKHDSPLPMIGQSAALDPQGQLYAGAILTEENATSGVGSAVCIDGKTGEERWHTDAGTITNHFNDCTAGGFYDGKYFLWCCVNGEKHDGGMKSFDAKTGRLVRDYPGVHSYWEAGCVTQPLFIGDKVYVNPTAGHEPYRVYDLASGQRVKNANSNNACDHPGSASTNAIFSGGEGFTVYDLITGKIWRDNYVRYSDFAFPNIAEGMFFHLPTVCHCPHAFGGPAAMAPAGEGWTPPDANEDIAARLVAGPAINSPLVDDPELWTHYRGNAGHTGETATAPKLPLKAAWERKLDGKLTAPTFGAGLVFVASRTGSVCGLDQNSGEIRWQFLCGSGVRVSPAFSRGRVLFGSYDGWVYCLDAKSGQLAWRFRAAPQERYFNFEGQIASVWPSAAGVVVDDKFAYCAAGLQAVEGTYLYALDIQSGNVAWAKRIGDFELNGAPQGIMALNGEHLVVPVFSGQQTHAYEKSDGKLIPWYIKGRRFWVFGSEAIADGDVYFYGGARLGNDDHASRPSAFVLMDMQSGWTWAPENAKAQTIAQVCIAPVLGKQTIVGDGAIYDRAKFQSAVRDDSAKVNDLKTWATPFWSDAKQHSSSLVLAGDTVLAASATADGQSEIAAFDARQNGKELDRLKLPGKPLRNSLAVSNGRVFLVSEDATVKCLGG